MATSAAQDRFISWLLTLKEHREPQTQKALAEELGLVPGTLVAWKRDEDFLRAWNAAYLRTIGSPGTKMEIMATLEQTATDPDDPKHVQAAKAYFEIEGSLRPAKSQVDINVQSTPPSELSDEQLQAMIDRKAGDELARRREAS